MSEKSINEEIEYQPFVKFLESTPPNLTVPISDLSEKKVEMTAIAGFEYDAMHTPEIQLHCDNDKCGGTRIFRCKSDQKYLRLKSDYEVFHVRYLCSNCQQGIKIYSISAKIDAAGESQGECFKLGEYPSYGPPISPKLITLIRPDRDEFIKGNRCENQGLGVGAFIYYRRVVEKQKERILNKIIAVSEKIGASEDKIEELKSAVMEKQFKKSLSMSKEAIPESLFIDGHNPILLLHSALSEGVHALTDKRCLELAGSIRVVLGELSDRLAQALKDEAEVRKALSALSKNQTS